MATDVEESDTDEHERPAPPKRPRTRLVNNENVLLLGELENLRKTLEEVDDSEHDEAERRATEKLKKWQACQLAKGFMDNTINRVLENYVLARSSSDSYDNPQLHLFRGYNEEMEDAAVMMAIRNHGLVRSTNLISHSDASHNSSGINGNWTDDEHPYIRCSYPSISNGDNEQFAATAATTSAGIVKSTKVEGTGRSNEGSYNEDRMDDSDQQQDFLERAVAEAIKKKGLSALSIDYG